MKTVIKPALALLIALLVLVPAVGQLRTLPVRTLDNSLDYINFKGLFTLEQDGHAPCDSILLSKWQNYFRQITRLMPRLPDAWGMLGFCYAYAHRDGDAIAALNKAIELNPYCWAFYYNLGAIYVRQNDVAKAGEYFQKAMNTPPDVNARFIVSSKIFTDIIRTSGQSLDLQARLKQDYALSFLAAKWCATALTEKNTPPPQAGLTPRMF